MKYITVSLLSLILIGCGGGSGGDGTDSSSFGGSASNSVQGVASKGPLRESVINRYSIDNSGRAVGSPESTGTDSGGNGNFSFGSAVGNATLVETCGGSFLDESDPATPKRKVTLQAEPCEGLKGILPANAMTVAVTPITHALYEKARRETNFVAGDFELVYGKNHANFQAALGLNPVTLLPSDPTNPVGNSAQKQYAMVLGGFAQVINAAAVKLGMSAPSYDLILSVIKDLSDGNIDGAVSGKPVTVGEGGPTLPDDIDFNAEIARFRNNNANAYSSVPLVVFNEELASRDESIPCVDPPDDLVGWWTADGTADDISGNKLHGILKNGAGFAAGKVGQAFLLDGVDDYVDIPHAAELDIKSQVTMVAWINPATISPDFSNRILDKTTGGVGETYSIDLRFGKLRAVINASGNGGGQVSGSTNIPTNTWTHVAASYDGSAIRVYVNGVLEGSLAATNPIQTNNRPLRIGINSSADSNNAFHGLVDEAALYDRALSQAELKAQFDAGASGICKNILRPDVLLCGNSQRDISTFFIPGTVFNIINGCAPNSNTQAMLVTRSGNATGVGLRDYVVSGGVVLTEYSISQIVWESVFGEQTSQGSIPGGGRLGFCTDAIPTVFQFNSNDPFWQANLFRPIQISESGCGYPVQGYPGITVLAGWDDVHAAVGYRDLGSGRVWATDFDWQDNQSIDNYTLELMGYMLTHRKP